MGMALAVSASPEYGRLQSDNTVFVGEKSAATIDFSNGVREPDGTVCVERRKGSCKAHTTSAIFESPKPQQIVGKGKCFKSKE